MIRLYAAIVALLCGISFTGASTLDAPVDFSVWIIDIEIAGETHGLEINQNIFPKIPAMYNPQTVIENSAPALSKFFADNGFPYNKISAQTIYENDGAMATLVFHVDPDERVCHGLPPVMIILQTHDHENDNARSTVSENNRHADKIAKDIAIVPETIYRASDIDETLRRLSMRGYVRSAVAVSPVIIGDAPPCVVDDEILRVAVTPFIVTENRELTIDGVIGYNSGSGGSSNTSLFGRLELSFLNMARRGERFDAAYSGAQNVQRFEVAGAVPWIFLLPLELGGESVLEVEDGDDGYGFFRGAVFGAFDVGARYRLGVTFSWSEVVPAGIDDSYYFYGAEFFAKRQTRPRERGVTQWELAATTGSGVAMRERAYNRSTATFSAGVHVPVVAKDYAVVTNLRAMSIFSDEERLASAELFRLGGHGSLRGYGEEELAFRAASYFQLEFHRYLDKRSSIYIFVDGGVGVDDNVGGVYMSNLSVSYIRRLFGYGAGIVFPTRLGMLSVEWARSNSGLGVVHVGVRSR